MLFSYAEAPDSPCPLLSGRDGDDDPNFANTPKSLRKLYSVGGTVGAAPANVQARGETKKMLTPPLQPRG